MRGKESEADLSPGMMKTRGRSGCWKRRALLCTIAFICLALASGCAYRWMAARYLDREMKSAARDPETGILLGAEPLRLGSGQKGVLLVHGFIGSPKDFGELPQRLAAAGFRVHVPLLPGHGTRPPDLLDENEDTLLAAVAESYRELRADCEWVGVVGFSMGGALVARMVCENVEPHPDALVFASPFFGVTYRWYAILPPATWNRICRPFIPYVIKGTALVQVNRSGVAPEIACYRTVPTYTIHCLSQASERVWESDSGVLPDRTLLIYSADDATASPRKIRKMADRWNIPATSRILLDRSNHHIFWDYDREEVINAVIEFFEKMQD